MSFDTLDAIFSRGGRKPAQADAGARDRATMIKALEVIAASLECGCMPCRGACYSADSLRDEVEGRRQEAIEALRAVGARP